MPYRIYTQKPIRRLLASSKVLVAAVGVVQTLVLHYTGVPPEVWASINVLLIAIIYGITKEDAAMKSNPANPAILDEETR